MFRCQSVGRDDPGELIRSNVAHKLIQRSIEIISHLNLSLENVPGYFLLTTWDSREHCNRLATIRDEDLLPCGGAPHQHREVSLGSLYVHYSSHNTLSSLIGV